MRRYLLVFLAGLCGCGTVDSTRIDYKPADSISFRFEDERPVEERLTTKSRSPAGHTTLLADDSITPPGPILLKAKLGETLSGNISGRKVVLSEFSVQIFEPVTEVNEQAFQSAANSVPGAGIAGLLFGRLLVGGIESVKSEKTVRVRIAGAVDAVTFGATAYGTFRGRVTEDDINSVILKALDETVSHIRNGLAKPPAAANAGDSHTAEGATPSKPVE